MHLYSLGNGASSSVAVSERNFLKICCLCLLLLFLSACGKTVSSEIDTAATENITENNEAEFERAEMILTEIPEEYAELMPDRELSFILDGTNYTLPCNVQNLLNNGWEFFEANDEVYVEKIDVKQYIVSWLRKDGVYLTVGIVNMSNNICNIERCDVYGVTVDETILSKFEFTSPDGVVYGDTQDVVREKMGDYIAGDGVLQTTGMLYWGDNSDILDCNSLVSYICNVKGRTEWLKDDSGNLISDENGIGIPYLADENGELLHPIGERDRVIDSLSIRAFAPWEIGFTSATG